MCLLSRHLNPRNQFKLGVAAQVFLSQHLEGWDRLWTQDQPGLHSKLWDSQGYIVSNEINSRDDKNSVGKTSRKRGVRDTSVVPTVLPLVSAGNGLSGNMWISERAIRTRNIKYYGKTIFDVIWGKDSAWDWVKQGSMESRQSDAAGTRPPKHTR